MKYFDQLSAARSPKIWPKYTTNIDWQYECKGWVKLGYCPNRKQQNSDVLIMTCLKVELLLPGNK